MRRPPGYVLAGGISVLTGRVAGKFTPGAIQKMLEKAGTDEKVSHRNGIVPGGAAVLSGKPNEVSGVGPRESSGIPSFIK